MDIPPLRTCALRRARPTRARQRALKTLPVYDEDSWGAPDCSRGYRRTLASHRTGETDLAESEGDGIKSGQLTFRGRGGPCAPCGARQRSSRAERTLGPRRGIRANTWYPFGFSHACRLRQGPSLAGRSPRAPRPDAGCGIPAGPERAGAPSRDGSGRCNRGRPGDARNGDHRDRPCDHGAAKEGAATVGQHKRRGQGRSGRPQATGRSQGARRGAVAPGASGRSPGGAVPRQSADPGDKLPGGLALAADLPGVRIHPAGQHGRRGPVPDPGRRQWADQGVRQDRRRRSPRLGHGRFLRFGEGRPGYH